MISMRNYFEIFLNAIDPVPKAHVLEIGVGRGEATSLLVRQLKIGQRLTCVDPHPLISNKLAWWIRVDPRLWHAVSEGGTRNGVMAAIGAFLDIAENNSRFTFSLLSEHKPGLGLITFET